MVATVVLQNSVKPCGQELLSQENPRLTTLNLGAGTVVVLPYLKDSSLQALLFP